MRDENHALGGLSGQIVDQSVDGRNQFLDQTVYTGCTRVVPGGVR